MITYTWKFDDDISMHKLSNSSTFLVPEDLLFGIETKEIKSWPQTFI